MRKRTLFLLIMLQSLLCKASSTDTVHIYSQAMKKPISCVVIIPGNNTNTASYPVVYLLHGYSGNYSNWIQNVPSLQKEADDLELIIVCPDGGFSSWYFDSPLDSTMKYETFIAEEVPAYIDTHYRTIKNEHGRAVTGLSMGGHGAMFIAMLHSKFFGACGSMSGVVDLLAFYKQFDIDKRIGDTVNNNTYWRDYSVIKLVEKYNLKDSLAIIIDCGINDFTYPFNFRLHKKMVQLNIPHDYIERPGEHNWSYWSNSVQYQLLFFRNYFDKYYKKG